MMETRRNAREWAIQMLTAADLNPPDDMRAFMDAYWSQIADLDDEDARDVLSPPQARAVDRVEDVTHHAAEDPQREQRDERHHRIEKREHVDVLGGGRRPVVEEHGARDRAEDAR